MRGESVDFDIVHQALELLDITRRSDGPASVSFALAGGVLLHVADATGFGLHRGEPFAVRG